jgi:hypothetical protein
MQIRKPNYRLIAFYLPQFFPIPENDDWWGKGFTEWTNVAKSRPLFRGHYQPHIPADLGFYDLRLPETREAQAELAKTFGIEAFCYYHYWFAGKRLLERVPEEVIETKRPDFPFCLAWANQSWTGIWHGNPGRVLVEQTYPGEKDNVAHFNYLLKAFTDDRYLKVDGKPLFFVYRPKELPNSLQVTDLWRELAIKAGLKGLYIVGQSYGDWNAQEHGFDASTLVKMLSTRKKPGWRRPLSRARYEVQNFLKRPTVHSYEEFVRFSSQVNLNGNASYPCIIPNWDNTPRSGSNGLVYHNSNPVLFREHVRHQINKVKDRPAEHRIVFIKSWNEWAEGNYLEPDRKFGHSYLETLAEEVF